MCAMGGAGWLRGGVGQPLSPPHAARPGNPYFYWTLPVTLEFAFRVNVQLFVLLPPLEQAPDHTASRPLVTLNVMAVPEVKDFVWVLPTGTLMPAGLERIDSPLRHRAHVFNLNYIYELPFLRHHSNALVRNTLAGWELSGVTFYQSGAPNTVTVPVDVARIGAGSTRATVIGDPNLPKDQRTLAHWFNAEAFLPPERMVQGKFGNSGRNVLIGPGLISGTPRY
jgi:hypothetical protein